MSNNYKQGNSTADYANDYDAMKCYREGLEAEALLDDLEKIYKRTDWRNVKQLVTHEAEIKNRLSEIYGNNK